MIDLEDFLLGAIVCLLALSLTGCPPSEPEPPQTLVVIREADGDVRRHYESSSVYPGVLEQTAEGTTYHEIDGCNCACSVEAARAE